MASAKATLYVNHAGELGVVIPADIPIFRFEEFLLIEHLGGSTLKLYCGESVVTADHGELDRECHATFAVLMDAGVVAQAVRLVESAAAAVLLLTPEDTIGAPIGMA